MADIFLSYARDDSDVAAALVAVFEERDWTVFWDLNRAIKQRFDAEGLSLAVPERQVALRQPADPGAGDKTG